MSAELNFDDDDTAQGHHSRVRGSGEKRRQVERLRSAPADRPAMLECVSPDQLRELQAWREAGPYRAFSVSPKGVTLRESRGRAAVWEASYRNVRAALAAIVNGAIDWHTVTASSYAPLSTPSAQPKAGGKQNLRKLRERAEAG